MSRFDQTLRGRVTMGRVRAIIGRRALRAPHHTASLPSVRGTLTVDDSGSWTYRPGEIGLADRGVLLLTDLPEFREEVVAEIGAAVRDGLVLYRPQARLRVPVNITVLATAAECPCGVVPCSCSDALRERFDARVRRFERLLSGVCRVEVAS